MNENKMDFYKVYPRENFHTKESNFYLYCYLDPFYKYKKSIKYKLSFGDTLFKYKPIYIGKASSNKGYRHNQHIPEFTSSSNILINNMDNRPNSDKEKYLTTILNNMIHNNNHNLPSGWGDYKKNWIMILKVFDTEEELIAAEKQTIQTIGTMYKHTGPLTNKLLG